MQLDDVADAMKPGVVAAIEKGLTFQEMTMAFRLAAVREARRRCPNNYRASLLLRMSTSHFKGLINGNALRRTSFHKGSRNAKKKAPAPASEVTA